MAKGDLIARNVEDAPPSAPAGGGYEVPRDFRQIGTYNGHPMWTCVAGVVERAWTAGTVFLGCSKGWRAYGVDSFGDDLSTAFLAARRAYESQRPAGGGAAAEAGAPVHGCQECGLGRNCGYHEEVETFSAAQPPLTAEQPLDPQDCDRCGAAERLTWVWANGAQAHVLCVPCIAAGAPDEECWALRNTLLSRPCPHCAASPSQDPAREPPIVGPLTAPLQTADAEEHTVCRGCESTVAEPHSWEECTTSLRAECDRAVNASVDAELRAREAERECEGLRARVAELEDALVNGLPDGWEHVSVYRDPDDDCHILEHYRHESEGGKP